MQVGANGSQEQLSQLTSSPRNESLARNLLSNTGPASVPTQKLPPSQLIKPLNTTVLGSNITKLSQIKINTFETTKKLCLELMHQFKTNVSARTEGLKQLQNDIVSLNDNKTAGKAEGDNELDQINKEVEATKESVTEKKADIKAVKTKIKQMTALGKKIASSEPTNDTEKQKKSEALKANKTLKARSQAKLETLEAKLDQLKAKQKALGLKSMDAQKKSYGEPSKAESSAPDHIKTYAHNYEVKSDYTHIDPAKIPETPKQALETATQNSQAGQGSQKVIHAEALDYAAQAHANNILSSGEFSHRHDMRNTEGDVIGVSSPANRGEAVGFTQVRENIMKVHVGKNPTPQKLSEAGLDALRMDFADAGHSKPNGERGHQINFLADAPYVGMGFSISGEFLNIVVLFAEKEGDNA